MSGALVSQVTFQNGIFNTILDRVTTTDATPFAISFTVPNNSCDDIVVVVIGRDQSNNGNFWRAYFETTYECHGNTVSGADPAAQNVRSNGGGAAYTAAVTHAGQNITVTVTGVAATNIVWEVTVQQEVLQ